MLNFIFYLLLLFIAIVALILGWHLLRVSFKNREEMALYEGKPEQYTNSLGKTLVIYYSLSGRTKQIAEKIAYQTNADIFEVKTAQPIGRGAKFYADIKVQLKNGKYPEIQQPLPDISLYDTIFVGAPVWWYTVATPVLSFLQYINFQGKKVVPFSTQGSNFGTFFTDFSALAHNAIIAHGQSFNNLSEKYSAQVHNKIIRWLNQL